MNISYIINSNLLTNKNVVFYKNSIQMKEIEDNSVDLVITSPPYFNVKDYSKNGKQDIKHPKTKKG